MPVRFKKTILSLVRSPHAAWFVGRALAHFPALLPVRRLYEDALVLVFHHPSPSWPFHVLAIPKRRRPSFAGLDLSHPVDEGLALRLLWSLQQAARSQNLPAYQVVVNGGSYQDVPQLHFHLIAGSPGGMAETLPSTYVPCPPAKELAGAGLAYHYAHPHSVRQTHEILAIRDPLPAFARLELNDLDHAQALLALLRLAQQRVLELDLPGYALVFTAGSSPSVPIVQPEPLHAHLIS